MDSAEVGSSMIRMSTLLAFIALVISKSWISETVRFLMVSFGSYCRSSSFKIFSASFVTALQLINPSFLGSRHIIRYFSTVKSGRYCNS